MTPLQSANGARREMARAFVNGWQYADRIELTAPYTALSIPDDHAPANQVLLAEFMAGVLSRLWGSTNDLESALAVIGE